LDLSHLFKAALAELAQCWKTEYQNTTKNLRHEFYSSIKKLENLPQYSKDSFIIGRNMLEKWSSLQTYQLEADVLIHLRSLIAAMNQKSSFA